MLIIHKLKYFIILLIYNSIVAGTATEAEAQLISHNSDENYDHVRVNFDVQGPATPEIIAYELSLIHI